MEKEMHSIPGDLIAIAYAVLNQAKVPKESISVIFDFEDETITFECHYCNSIIPGLSVNFVGHDLA